MITRRFAIAPLARRLFVAGALVAGIGLMGLLLTSPAPAAAHPLGNFTINVYDHLQLSTQGIRLRHIVDMAEIPAFQELEAIDADGDGSVSRGEERAYLHAFASRTREELALDIAGERVRLEPAASDLSFPAGQAGLNTQRVVIDYVATLPAAWREDAPLDVGFRDTSYEGRIGWREVIVSSLDGVNIARPSVPPVDVSDELTSYPDAGSRDPLNVSSAEFQFRPGPGTGTPALSAIGPDVGPGQAPGGDRFTSLISSDEVTVPFVLGAMLIAACFGALHALGPGHGKTVVAAFLVGERGTARHALTLGLTVTATHTVSVFALGLITLYASQFIVPEKLYPWLAFASGLAVLVMGGALLAGRLRALRRHRREQDHLHGHRHDEGHEHGHSHDVPGTDGSPVTWKGLLALGVSGGILPCPSALVVLLGAISLHRVGLGLLLVVAFSAGLAAVLTGIGLALVWAGRWAARSRWLGERGPLHRIAFVPLLIRALPSLSALAITAVGAVMIARAVMGESSGGFGLL